MVELTEQQVQAVTAVGPTPLTVLDPKTKTPYVLVRKDVFELLAGDDYADGPWNENEMDALATEAGELLDQYRKYS